MEPANSELAVPAMAGHGLQLEHIPTTGVDLEKEAGTPVWQEWSPNGENILVLSH